MPIYEYVCQDCKKEFEVLKMSIKAEASVQCPACQSTDIRKAMSAGSFRMHSDGSSLPACGAPTSGGGSDFS